MRKAAADVLGGWSLRSTATSWNAQGLATTAATLKLSHKDARFLSQILYNSGVASAYEVEVENSAARVVQRLQRHDQICAVQAMADLATEPRPDGCTKLSGMESAYRIRVGNYRIVYAVDDAERLVTVTRVGHRREVYR